MYLANNLSFPSADKDRDFGDAKDILVRYLNKDQLKNLFRELGLADKTLKNNFQNYGDDQYADEMLEAWINGRDNVLNNPAYSGGATWENLRKGLAKLGHHGAAAAVQDKMYNVH